MAKIDTEKEVQKYKSMVGMRVHKRRSGKPFKSGLKINTVKAADVVHPVTGNLCFTFVEDESYVVCYKCEAVE